MKMNRILAACGAALAVCSVSAFGGPEKFRADLPDVLANAQDGELVPVTIIMQAQAEPFDLNELRSMDKAMRCQFVIEELQAVVASATQGGVMGILDRRSRTGRPRM